MKLQQSYLKRTALAGSTALTLLVGASVSTDAIANPVEGQRPGDGGPPVQEDAPGYIIVFKNNVDAQATANELKAKNGLKIGRVYRHAIKGVFVPTDLPFQSLEALKKNPNIAYVEKNGVCRGSAQTVPTGIDRAEVEYAVAIDGVDDLIDVDIAVIDSGIDSTHPDLRVNHSMSVAYYFTTEGRGKKTSTVFNESFEEAQWTDQHGHGTHVAGIAGAIDNEIGVVGSAPGARLASVRVLNSDNRGSWAQILAGMDYVTANADTFEVANISIGGGYYQSVNDAIQNMTNAGVVAVVAAGNYSADAANYSPASAPSAITVSAISDTDGIPGGLGPDGSDGPEEGPTRGPDDTLAVFSNYGAAVDVAAPGVDIYSTHWENGYTVMSGTSMATPLVAGAIALHIARNGRDRDGNGVINGDDVALMETLVASTGWQLGDPEYFEGDPDTYPESLLNVANLLGHEIDQFPTVSLTSPSDGAIVSGTITLQADASDDYAVTQVEFFVDGVSVGIDIDSSDGFWLNWISALVSDGDHEISAVATDDAAQTSSSGVIVSVDNVDSGPVADAGADQTVQDGDASGTELVTLDGTGSSDDRGISGYEWYAGASLIATGVSPSLEFPVGIHTITLVVIDSIGQTAQDSVLVTVEEAPPVGAQVSVGSISIFGFGGKNSNNHLQAVANIQDDLGVAVAGAVVEANLYRGGALIASSTSTTDAAGSAFLFDERNISAGCYRVVITNVTAARLTFDGATPANQFCK